MQRHGKFITNLKADMRYFPVSKPIKNPDGTYLEPAPSSKLFISKREKKNYCLLIFFTRLWRASHYDPRV